MNIFLCPDKFKGSASSDEVIAAMAEGIRTLMPNTPIKSTAISDGGDGFATIASQHLDGEWFTVDSQDALHRPIQARYFISQNVAYIDMASTNGLVQIAEADRDPMASSTIGTGLLLRDAAEKQKVGKIFIGLGGSATNDGGAGMASALGARFLDSLGNALEPIPSQLLHCCSIDTSELIPMPPIIAACDVNNPLLGENGATYIYGPQKGVIVLEDADAILAHLMMMGNGEKDGLIPGSGAAGGIAYGLLHYCNAHLESGFDIVSGIIGLEKNIQDADIVITGEGSLDSQTLNGKGPHGVANLAAKYKKRVFAIAGHIEPCVEDYFENCYALSSLGLPLETCMAEAPRLISQLAEKLAKELLKTSS
jgi:glycerate kinase